MGAESPAFAGAGRIFKMYTGVRLSGSAQLNGHTHRRAMTATDGMRPHDEKKSGRHRKRAWGGKSLGPEPGPDESQKRIPFDEFIKQLLKLICFLSY